MEKELIVCRCEEILEEESVDAICRETRSLSAMKQRTGTSRGLEAETPKRMVFESVTKIQMSALSGLADRV